MLVGWLGSFLDYPFHHPLVTMNRASQSDIDDVTMKSPAYDNIHAE